MFTHLCGAGLSLSAFAASLIIGLYVNNPFVTVVKRSVLIMVCFYVIGCGLSVLGQKVIQENFNNEFQDELKNDNASGDQESQEIAGADRAKTSGVRA